MKIILFFIDGLGIGENISENPLYRNKNSTLGFYLDQFKSSGSNGLFVSENKIVYALDPIMGVKGIPQSATGQTSIFTGKNAQETIGNHITGFPDKRLRKILKEDNLLSEFKSKGYDVSFVNVFNIFSGILSSGKAAIDKEGLLLPDILNRYSRMISVTTSLGIILGQYFYNLDDLRTRKSIYQDFTGRSLKARVPDIPLFSPSEAAEILFGLLDIHDVILYEYFQTDRAGHGKSEYTDRISYELDEFVKNLEQKILQSDNEIHFFIFSDHGNYEDLSVKSHTLNPVPFIHFSNKKFQTDAGFGKSLSEGKAGTETDKIPVDISDIYPYILSQL